MVVGTQRFVDTDVLIVGGGIAGLLAAITARQSSADVVVASKGPAGRSGCSVVAAGTFLGYEPGDDLSACVREACETADLLDDPAVVEIVITESYHRRLQFEEWGVGWEKENGKFVRKPGLGHKSLRNVYFHGAGQLMSVIRGEAVRRGAKVLDRVMITDLLTSDGNAPTPGKVIGAVGFGVRDAAFYVIRAKAVVMAAGDWGMGQVLTGDVTGDGQAAAWRVGAQMRNMEQMGYTVGPKAFISMPGLHPITGHGGRFVNTLGERFMERYHPELKERAPRPVIAQGVTREIQLGRGPVYLDCRHLNSEDLARLALVIPHTIRALQRIGIDLSRDLVEYVPALNGNEPTGGVRTNRNGETTVEGLFCAGSASDRMYAGLGGLAGASVLGWRAGEVAARYAMSSARTSPMDEQIDRLRGEAYAPLRLEKGSSPRELFLETLRLVNENIGPLKHEARLKQAVEGLERARRENLPRVMAKDGHTLMRANELRNILEIAELIARTSLMRTESRYFNYREDYPERDDVDWLKWVIVKLEDNGRTKVWTEDIPTHK